MITAKIEYGLDRVSKDSIRNSVKSRSDHVTVTESGAAFMSLSLLGKARPSEDPKPGELPD